MSTASNINTLGVFCGKRDISSLTSSALQQDYGIDQVDVFVLFGGSILAGGDVLAEAIDSKIAKKYIIVGGYGHTTATLQKQVQQEFPELPATSLAEAEIFQYYLQQKYGHDVDCIETQSTNCGNNITNLLELLQQHDIKLNSIVLSQDATMQHRMDAILRKYVPSSTIIINYATYQAEVVEHNGQLEYVHDINGMWDIDRYTTLLMGEIPRLRDDANGYGPRGKDYLVHVDIPPKVEAAFKQLQQQFPDAVRKANPEYG